MRFDYVLGEAKLSKVIGLSRKTGEAVLIYRLTCEKRGIASLGVCPFTGMRDFHGTSHASAGNLPIEVLADGVAVQALGGGPRLVLGAEVSGEAAEVHFEPEPDWWYGIHHRAEAARGLDCREDLFKPGWFRAVGLGSLTLTLRGRAEFPWVNPVRADRCVIPADFGVDGSEKAEADQRLAEADQRLAEACGAFVVRRQRADGGRTATVLAGYPWFGDWGRDAFIALPGLMLETGRFAEAKEVLTTFASAQQDGLIPNRFSDYGDGCDYNSVDASLWYIHAADAYVRASGDDAAWEGILGVTCQRIVDAFLRGTQFNIHVDGDMLVSCGDASTQLTWMDAKCGEVVFTPRHGKPVEINALWYHGLLILAERLKSSEPGRAARYEELAGFARESFLEYFWNCEHRCLYDVVRGAERDASVRPNQIFAVSLAHSPLSAEQQKAVVACVEHELLTPMGLRTLSPADPRYRGRYAGGPFERDGAYHQGTVWPWLMGHYVEAYLRVHQHSAKAKAAMREQLQPLIAHLGEAGLGSISEVFDGDPPHRPGACVAQAWSVAEVLRAWRMTEPVKHRQGAVSRSAG